MPGEAQLTAASGGGSAAFVGPPTSSANTKLKLPADTGSAGQVLKIKSANHSSTNAELEWAADSGGLFSSYAILEDQKSNGTDAGGITSGSWVKRDLNTETSDPDGIVSLSSDQFTLGAGTYLIKWRAPGYHCNIFCTQLKVTSGTFVHNGADSSAVAGDPTYCRDLYHYGYSEGAARITITGDKTFEIQQQASTTANTNGLGLSSPFNAGVEVYTRVEIYKEAS